MRWFTFAMVAAAAILLTSDASAQLTDEDVFDILRQDRENQDYARLRKDEARRERREDFISAAKQLKQEEDAAMWREHQSHQRLIAGIRDSMAPEMANLRQNVNAGFDRVSADVNSLSANVDRNTASLMAEMQRLGLQIEKDAANRKSVVIRERVYSGYRVNYYCHNGVWYWYI